jgi:dethiobiotin synthetase
MKSFFITGTDTGVGKTLVGGGIAGVLKRSGKRVGVLKPFESGCSKLGGELIPEDALFLKNISGCAEDIDVICPYRMEHPLAPGVAAEIEGVAIDLDRVRSCFKALKEKYETVLVEGAGGLMVPVTGDLLISDLIKMLDLPIIIVSRLSLGTINHTLLTVKHALACGISVAGIILNQVTPEIGKAEETNPEVIKRFSGIPILGQIPFIPHEKRNNADFIVDAIQENIDLSSLGLIQAVV